MEIRRTAGVTRALVILLVAGVSMQLNAQPKSQGAIGRVSVADGPASPIYAFTFGVEQSGGGATGGGAGTGKAVLDDVAIVKNADALSTSLLNYVVTGLHLPRVRVEIYGANANQIVSTFELEDVIVTRFETSGAAGESVAFGYRTVRLTSGGAIVVFDEQTSVFEGVFDWPRTIVVRFESRADALAWYESPEYQAVLPLRLEATEGFAMLADGYDGAR